MVIFFVGWAISDAKIYDFRVVGLGLVQVY